MIIILYFYLIFKMMELPTDILYIIINYLPTTGNKLVCKKWKSEIDYIFKRSSNIIGNWYNKIKCHSLKNFGEHINVEDLIRNMIIHYPNELFICYPEKVVKCYDLNNNILSVLPKIIERKKSDVKYWLLCMPLIIRDFRYIEHEHEY